MATINCAFQTWNNDEISGIYLGEEARQFVEDHYNSGTFATLHTFESVEAGQNAYFDILYSIEA